MPGATSFQLAINKSAARVWAAFDVDVFPLGSNKNQARLSFTRYASPVDYVNVM